MQKERSRTKNNPLPHTQGNARDFWWDRVNEPVRPSIKVLLLIPLGFGISIIWEMITIESGAAQDQQSLDIGSTLMMGLAYVLIIVPFVVLPLYLILGNSIRVYLQPILSYFFKRWQYVVPSLFGAPILYMLGVFAVLEKILTRYTEGLPSIVLVSIIFLLLILLSELVSRTGKLLLSLFTLGHHRDK